VSPAFAGDVIMAQKGRQANMATTKLDLALGLRIRLRRKGLGMAQTALADAVGITFQQIQKYEQGHNRVSFSRLVDIAHALSCRVIDLIGDIDDAGIPSPLFRQQTAHLRESGAPELMAAYAAAPPSLRRAILRLVVEIANDQPGPPLELDDAVKDLTNA
jgi:transcriptional regulator with XRE-family HTH domain